jgi:predicted nucleic acid-binding protein
VSVSAYLDTNVLVAASVRDHPHYVQSFDLVKDVKEGAVKGYISTHGLAEFYSVLTRTPFNPRIQPADAGRFLEDNLLACFEVVPLSADDYKTVLRSCTQKGLIGGAVSTCYISVLRKRHNAIASTPSM